MGQQQVASQPLTLVAILIIISKFNDQKSFGLGIYYFNYQRQQTYTQSMVIGYTFQEISDWVQKDKITNFQLDHKVFVLLNSSTFSHFAEQQLNDNILTQLEAILKVAPIKVIDIKVTFTKISDYDGTMKFILYYKQNNILKKIHLQLFPKSEKIPAIAWYFGFFGLVNYLTFKVRKYLKVIKLKIWFNTVTFQAIY